ncbi:MAG: hypothetical protein GY861_03020 [bacterium]|nr:hypothetical protein [bacterium]
MESENRAYTIRTATYDEASESNVNYYNLPMVIEYKGKIHILSCGTSDSITVLRSDNDMIVLSTNFGLDYAGIQIVDFSTLDYSDENGVFISSINEQLDDLDKDFFDYSENTQADILMQYLDI